MQTFVALFVEYLGFETDEMGWWNSLRKEDIQQFEREAAQMTALSDVFLGNKVRSLQKFSRSEPQTLQRLQRNFHYLGFKLWTREAS